MAFALGLSRPVRANCGKLLRWRSWRKHPAQASHDATSHPSALTGRSLSDASREAFTLLEMDRAGDRYHNISYHHALPSISLKPFRTPRQRIMLQSLLPQHTTLALFAQVIKLVDVLRYITSPQGTAPSASPGYSSIPHSTSVPFEASPTASTRQLSLRLRHLIVSQYTRRAVVNTK